MNLNIKKFDPKILEKRRVEGSGPPTCVFIGKRGTGKTILVADILYHTRKTPMGVVMSGTEESCNFYGNYVPDSFIYDDYNSGAVETIIEQQRKNIKDESIKGDKSVFLLLDDCMYDKKNMRSKSIRGIFMNGRHWKISLYLTMQYCMDLPPDLRANVDYVFILREPVLANRQKLYKNFFGIFPTFDSFSDTMLACTENYECLVLDNTSKSNKIEDVVFWYKAHFPLPKFRIGTKELWLYHKKSCKVGTESKSETRLDPKKLKKKGNSIIVKKMGKKKKSARKD